jgi:hypothetical protein
MSPLLEILPLLPDRDEHPFGKPTLDRSLMIYSAPSESPFASQNILQV